MKKALNCAMIYGIAGLAGGVFYREFTKLNGFKGVTMLSSVHTHLLALGMLLFLLVALFAQRTDLENTKGFRVFMVIYNAGLALTAVMMTVRGILEVLAVHLSSGLSAAVSGIAGIGHMMTGAGIILLLAALKKTVK